MSHKPGLFRNCWVLFCSCKLSVAGARMERALDSEDRRPELPYCPYSVPGHTRTPSCCWKGKRHHTCDSDGWMIKLLYKHRVSVARTNSYLYGTTMKSYLQNGKPWLPSKDNLPLLDTTPASCKLTGTAITSTKHWQQHKTFLLFALPGFMLLQANLQMSSHLSLPFHPIGTHQTSLEPSSKKTCPLESTK